MDEHLIITVYEVRRNEWGIKVMDRRTRFHARVVRRVVDPPWDEMITEAITRMAEERAQWRK